MLILNIQNLDINIGDYLVIDDEIVRVKTNVPSTPTNPISVFRGVLGSRAVNHAINSVVRRIRVEPIELRRHSINRASGHTFEYVGFGPGNYSTALPDKQIVLFLHKKNYLHNQPKKMEVLTSILV
jgi:hypothetical protein